jgi:hypothetical protein
VTLLFIVFAVQLIMKVKITGGAGSWIWYHTPAAVKGRISTIPKLLTKEASMPATESAKEDKSEKPGVTETRDEVRTSVKQSGNDAQVDTEKGNVVARRTFMFWLNRTKGSEDEETGKRTTRKAPSVDTVK